MISCSNSLQLLKVAGKDFCYHKECYKKVTNKNKIERSKQRFKRVKARNYVTNKIKGAYAVSRYDI